VGYEEVVVTRYNPALRVFNMFVVVVGVVITLYAFSVLTAFLVEGELRNLFWRRTMEKRIRELKDHFIICGLGDTGRYAVQELHKTGTPFIVIESNEENVKRFHEQEDGKYREVLYVAGDATDAAVLDSAGLDRAQGVIAAVANDKDNLVITVMVRQKTHKARIVARCANVAFAERLLKAGANTAVSPNAIGGLRLASEALRPHVTSFLDMMLREKTRTLRIDEIIVPASSPWCGKCLEEIKFRARYHLVPLAVKRASGDQRDDYLFNPPESLALQAGSVVIVMGDVEEAQRARQDALAPEAAGISS
jgi:voltage-gated potassium channel